MPAKIKKRSTGPAATHACRKCASLDVVHHRVHTMRLSWLERLPCNCGRVATAWFRAHCKSKTLRSTFGLDHEGFMTELARVEQAHNVHPEHEEECAECPACHEAHIKQGTSPEFEPLEVERGIVAGSLVMECRACGHTGRDTFFEQALAHSVGGAP
jgi:hypothetical protein